MKTPPPEVAAPGPGRPLDPEISDRVLEATLVLLAEDGFARLSIEAVAQRAGVHKPAVYRRWPSKIDLVVAAVRSRTPPAEDPATGNTRDDLIQLIRDAARNAQRNPHARAGLRLMAEAATDPELASAVRSRIVGERRAITRACSSEGSRLVTCAPTSSWISRSTPSSARCILGCS